MTKKSLFFVFIIFIASYLFSQESSGVNVQEKNEKAELSLEKMLASYIAQDVRIQIATLQLQKTMLALKTSENNASFNVELSTGTISVASDMFRAEPSITVSMPKLNGTQVQVNVPVLIKEIEEKSAFAGTTTSVKTEIFGNSSKNLSLSLQKSKRTLIESERKLNQQVLNVEQEFYTQLKNLYNLYDLVLDSENELYEKKIDLETLKIQGYSEKSPKYRTVYLEILSCERNFNEKQRDLQKALFLFFQKCDVKSEDINIEDLPAVKSVLKSSNIISTENNEEKINLLKNIVPMNLANYTEKEQAEWNLYIAQQEKKLNNFFSLDAEAGYIFQDSNSKGEDSAKIALVANGFGGQISSGMSIPITGEKHIPSATFSLRWSPQDFSSQKNENQQKELDIQVAMLNVLNAEESFENELDSLKNTWSDLIWSRNKNLEELEMYKTLARDMENWYGQGLISVSENRKAQINLKNAELQCKLNDIDLILQYLKTKSLFVLDIEN